MTPSIRDRVLSLDWDVIREDLREGGYALLPPLLNRGECDGLRGMYAEESVFRSHVVMSRFGFGRGEYKYFKYPLPELVADVRESLYPQLARIANAWTEEKAAEVFPQKHSDYLEHCRSAGQCRPTPLLLKYQAGDFNCLHQDLYGEVAFPLQATFFLSRLAADYTGGEFVLVEQRPRMQSRARVITAEQGQAVIFPTRYRWVRGTRGHYRTNLRHGVSLLHSGERYTLGVIFHDAK